MSLIDVDGALLVLTAPGTSTPCRLHRDGVFEDLSASAVGIEEREIGVAGMPGLAVSPNPGTGSFAFSVFLPIGCDVRLGVYDLGGKLISTVSENSLLAGSHAFAWDGSVPAGVYAVRLDAGEKTVSRLMTICE